MTGLVPTGKSGMPTPSAELANWLRFERDHGRATNAPPMDSACRAEAARLVRSVEASLVQAPATLKCEWLARLAMVCAGKNESEAAIRAKVAAYADMLDHPAWVFNAQTLKEAAARFMWFPSFAEVKGFLDERCASERRFLASLRKAADAEIPKVSRETPATPEQVTAILKANDLYTAAPRRKRLSLNYRSPLSEAERATVRREIEAKEHARRAKEGVA